MGQLLGGNIVQGSGVARPRLHRGAAAQRPGLVLGVPPVHPLQQQLHERLEGERGLGRIRGAAAGERLPVHVARHGDEQHVLDRTVERLDGALQMRAVSREINDGHGEGTQGRGHGGTQELFAAVHPDQARQAAGRAEGLGTVQGHPQGRQHRIRAGGVGRHGHPRDDFGVAVDEPGHPGLHELLFEQHPHGHTLVVACPGSVAVRGRAPCEDVESPPGSLPLGKPSPLPKRQVPAQRPVDRRQRRGSRQPGIGLGPLLKLAVHGGGVASPQHQQPPDLRGDAEPCPGRRVDVAGGARRSDPPPHRTLRAAHGRGDQLHVRAGQLAALVQRQQPRQRGQPPRAGGENRFAATVRAGRRVIHTVCSLHGYE